jgi:translation initiation factor 1
MPQSPPKPPRNAASLVFSTGVGRICPGCRRPAADCVCRTASGAAAGARASAAVRVSRQTQGRSGRGVTVISGLPLTPAELEQLAGELKRRCGSGGTVREGTIEIQGEHRDTLVAELERRGITARRSGG